MGKFRKIQSIFWPVKVKIAKGGKKFDTEAIEIKYQRLDADEMNDFRAENKVAEDATENEATEIGLRIIDGVKSYVTDWKIEDDNGDPLEFNEQNLDMVMNHPDYRLAIINGFWDVQIGGASKN